jgi:hypothetical protein
MFVTYELLESVGACRMAMDWFTGTYPDGVEIAEDVLLKTKAEWVVWLAAAFDPKQSLLRAAVDMALDILRDISDQIGPEIVAHSEAHGLEWGNDVSVDIDTLDEALVYVDDLDEVTIDATIEFREEYLREDQIYQDMIYNQVHELGRMAGCGEPLLKMRNLAMKLLLNN